MHILILDLTHGGDVLAERYIRKGHEVTAVDIYGLAKDSDLELLRSRGIIAEREVPVGHYDLLVSPVHCPDSYISGASYGQRMNFHQAVGSLVDNGIRRVEVTGVKGKTTACYLLARILSMDGSRVLLHTSRARESWEDGEGTVLDDSVSIAPTSLLTLPEEGYDVIVAEVSLGGSGEAALSLMTNLAEDYPIANGTRRASEAKASVFNPKGVNLIPSNEMDVWQGHAPPGVKGYGGEVDFLSPPILGGPQIIEVMDEVLELSPDSLLWIARGSLDAAVAASISLGVSKDAILEGLRGFKGVTGRCQYSSINGTHVVTERNPGISSLSMGHMLGQISRENDLKGALIVVIPANRKVCEKMDLVEMETHASSHGAEMMVCDGDPPDLQSLAEDRHTILVFQKEAYQ